MFFKSSQKERTTTKKINVLTKKKRFGKSINPSLKENKNNKKIE
jgi:hypothetical protein